MLVLDILIPLARSIVKKQYASVQRVSTNIDDIKQIVTTEIFSSILKYDSTRNKSFFGYINSMLPLNVQSAIREKKSEQESASLEQMLDTNPNLFPSEDSFEEDVDLVDLQKKVSLCMESLPEKEKLAIKKAYFRNEKLSETERKAKNRGLHKFKVMYPELKRLLQ